jgi:ribosomal protein L11 methyltransferase
VLRLAVRVAREHAELVLAELLELAPGGVEERALPGGDVEYSVYAAPGELPALPALKAAAGDALVDVYTEDVAGDWEQRWREFHRPLVLGDRLTVRPPWEPAAGGTALDVVIDPGRAFGTGAHATTRLCLEAMLEVVPEVVPEVPGAPSDAMPAAAPGAGAAGAPGAGAAAAPGAGAFIDLGCGSGVLAITAAKLGWGPVLALDYDAAAIEATIENAGRNGVVLEARRYDLHTDPVETSVASAVTANLLAPLLVTWAGRLATAAECPELVIASGLLEREADRVAQAFAGLGVNETRRLTRGDWIALVLASRTPNAPGLS